MNDFEINQVQCAPFEGQKPGTSGLRKKTTVFSQTHYLQTFIQSIFDALPQDQLQGATLVVSGDGRYFSQEAGQIILKMAAANGVGKIVLGQDFLMSTPAVSAVIRQINAYGGIIMTASHNPGGPEGDFGVKYNISNGGAAPESVTGAIYEISKTIHRYRIADIPDVDTSVLGVTQFGDFSVEVIDTSEIHVELLKSVFDFDALRAFVQRPDFSLVFDAMHGIAGPSARRIFVQELGLDQSSVIHGDPSPDFNGGHPDPNLTYAHDLVEIMGLHGDEKEEIPEFGAAADGDADRNMILGKKFFVTPSDSVAIIAANATAAIPYFREKGLSGVARSMPTSAAIDRVATKLGIDLYEVPTGWKFFGNLLDAGRIAICGEESFGTGSDHIREKDGIWAVLAWLSILEYKNRGQDQFVSVEDIVKAHWKEYGRNYYTRYDYEEVEKDRALSMFGRLREIIAGSVYIDLPDDCDFKLAEVNEFSYNDPVDGSVSSQQGIRIIFTDGSRIVFRLSGTGSVGATIRMYIEKYESNPDLVEMETAEALKSLVNLALQVSQLSEFTGRNSPTVIT